MDTVFFAEMAWLGGDTPTRNVVIETSGGRIVDVSSSGDTTPPRGCHVLKGLTVPGLANSHSHVFHRAIRGVTQAGVADFWAWRDLMYEVAYRLEPETLYRLAFATYVEMALSGITSVGEFHYLHHGQNGKSYPDPNELGRVVVQAATDAGIRITLLDTCYLTSDIDGGELDGVQKRFGDGTWESWADRVTLLAHDPGDLVDGMWKLGGAIHSVRAVPREAMTPIAGFVRTVLEGPLHVHLSEQPLENEDCMRAHGMTPTQLLNSEGVLGIGTTAIHGTHLTDHDINLLGESGTQVAICSTTERDLADGVGPAVRLLEEGSPLCVGSDAHMMIDLWEEARAIELNARIVSGKRGHLSAEKLLHALTTGGATSLGWDGGRIATGALADLVTVDMDSMRTAGARSGDPLAHVMFAASPADVTDVVVNGTPIVSSRMHVGTSRPGVLLGQAISSILDSP